MKINFEIDSNDMKDVLDAIRMLDTCIGGKYIESNTCEDVSVPLLEEKNKDSSLIEEYESRIKELESQIDCLNNQVKSFEESANELVPPSFEGLFGEDEILELKSKIESLESENKAKEDKIALLESQNKELSENKESIDLANYIEKVAHEKVVAGLNKEIELHKGRSEKNFQKNKDLRTSIDVLAKEKKELEIKLQTAENSSSNSSENIEDLNCTIAKLKDEVEYHKGRSDRNFQSLNQSKEEIKELKKENKELSEKIKDNSGSESNIDIEGLKVEFAEQKNKYESQISELKLACDKSENELAYIRSKYNEEDSKELNELRYIKKTICSNDRGRAFWNGIESQVQTKLNSK